MDNYVSLYDYAKKLDIHKGDIVFTNSDSKIMLFDAMRNKASRDLNLFIDGMIDAVGPDGTIIFPTYNWGYCSGKAFDYRNTESETGSIGSLALKRSEFKRTRHPIYSMAVYGKYQDELVSMDNTDSFGLDSPFAFLKNHNAINCIIDVTLKHCFTFVHFVEEQSGVVHHRFIKDFTGEYIDANGNSSIRTYSMFVRDLNMDVETTIDPIENDFISKEVEKIYKINNSDIKKIELRKAYDILLDDIVNNDSGKVCVYKGQKKIN